MIQNFSETQKLKRGLSNRHIQLMSIGGAIGTGLFMGAGKAINAAGPSILFIYAITGLILFFVMRAMGELLLSNLEYKSFLDFSNLLLGSYVGFIVGWTYWLCWVVTCTADIIAICHYATFWWPHIYELLPAIIAICGLILLNYVDVKFFGEVEFWFALIKIITILAIIAIALYILYNNMVPGSSIWNIWNNGNIAPNGLHGFLAGFQIAIFSFVGIELAGTAAAEVENPTKVLPKAINSIPLRIIFCYIFSLIAILLITPWYKISPQQSPFVYMFITIGLPMGASIVNFTVLLSALSSANSGVFSASRMLFGLAQLNIAPKFLGKLTKHKAPVNALVVSGLCLTLSYFSIYYVPNITNAFMIITSFADILFIIVWSIILLSYIAYRRTQPELHLQSNYKLPGGLITVFISLIFFSFILCILALDRHTQIALLITPLWFIILKIIYNFTKYRVMKP